MAIELRDDAEGQGYGVGISDWGRVGVKGFLELQRSWQKGLVEMASVIGAWSMPLVKDEQWVARSKILFLLICCQVIFCNCRNWQF